MFHVYHLFSFVYSILAYLISSFINSSAAKLGLSYSMIGLINFFGAASYITGSLTFGHIGDKIGHKKFLILEMLIFSVLILIFSNFGGIAFLFVFAIAANLFFGSFYPQIEGLIARNENLLNIDHSKTIIRFNLSWSLGNIFGMAFGPFLTVKMPQLIFIFGFVLNLLSSSFVFRDFKKHGEKIIFQPRKTLYSELVHIDYSNIKLYRLVYRITLFFSGLIYTAILSLFPKLINVSGFPLKISGFVIVFANISVFLTFLIMGKLKIWVNNPKISFLFLFVLPLTSMLMFAKMNLFLFALISFLGGMCYAIPYTFAIYYGLTTQENDQGKQGGFHEATIGMLFGFGPLIGGVFSDIFEGIIGLGVMGIILSLIIFLVQILFLKKLNENNFFKKSS